MGAVSSADDSDADSDSDSDAGSEVSDMDAESDADSDAGSEVSDSDADSDAAHVIAQMRGADFPRAHRNIAQQPLQPPSCPPAIPLPTPPRTHPAHLQLPRVLEGARTENGGRGGTPAASTCT